MKRFLTFSIICLSCSAIAAEFEFKAPLTNSTWKNEETSQLVCRLVHDIPEYGKVEFTSRAAKNRQLVFNMRPLMETKNEVSVNVRAIAPNYRPGVRDNDLSVMKSYKYFAGELSDKDAWTITSALLQGRNVGFFFNDWYYQDRPVQVTINSINFKKNFSLFQQCMQNLLPYGFEDVSFTVVNFVDGTSDLTPESKVRLDRLINYLSLDKNISELVIDSYSDSFGTPEHNRKVSAERAVVIGKYIEQSGLPSSKMIENAYGEKEHIASNNTEEGRTANRRVVISVKQSSLQELKHEYKAPQDLGTIDIGGVHDNSVGSEDDMMTEDEAEKLKNKGPKPFDAKASQNSAAIDKNDMNTETAQESNMPNLAKEEDSAK